MIAAIAATLIAMTAPRAEGLPPATAQSYVDIPFKSAVGVEEANRRFHVPEKDDVFLRDRDDYSPSQPALMGTGGFGVAGAAPFPSAASFIDDPNLVDDAKALSDAVVGRSVEKAANDPARRIANRNQAAPAAIATPIPPSALLFVTGLLGLKLSRRKGGPASG